jgi:hypothetical protein
VVVLTTMGGGGAVVTCSVVTVRVTGCAAHPTNNATPATTIPGIIRTRDLCLIIV